MTVGSAVQLRLPEDARTKGQRSKDRKRAAVQVARAIERGTDRTLLEEFADKVIDARRLRRRGGGERVYDEFERLETATDGPILVVAREYLVRADELTDEQRQGLIDGGARPIVEGRVLRVTEDRRGRGGKQRLQRSLARSVPRTGGASGRAVVRSARPKEHFVTPMGPVMKAVTGPEPSAALPAAASQSTARTSGPQVAVIDTGLPATPRGDGWLAGIPVDPENTDLLDDLPPEGRLDLGAGHGTFASGIVQQLAPNATIRVYRALDSDGFGTEAMVATAMLQAAADGAVVINLSLGLETDDDEPPIALEAAVELIREQWPQVLIVAAAGNFGHSRPCWPAAFKGVTAVAGLDRKLKPAVWSSHGPWVDCSTIGEAVLSTFVAGTERDDVDPDEVADSYPPDAWAIWSGTSFAAPQVVGAVAQIVETEALAPRDALARLLQGSDEVSNFGRTVKILPPT
jgi:subtilisin family serine protease